MVYRFLTVAVGPHDADDVFQEAYLSALRAYPRCDDRIEARPVDARRSRRARPSTTTGARRGARYPARCPRPAHDRRRDRRRPLWTAVGALPPKQRVAVVHRHVLDRPYAEIAAMMGTTEQAARANVWQGRDGCGSGCDEAERDLTRLAPAADAAQRARAAAERLRERALEEGLVDVALGARWIPVGEMQVAVTPRGLASTSPSTTRTATLFWPATRGELSPRVVRGRAAHRRGPPRARGVLRGDGTVRDGARPATDAPVREEGADARRRRSGYGQLATYGEIATRIGRPTAARAVGAALGSNPIPIVVPCHRIVGAGGRLTGYAGGLDSEGDLAAARGLAAPGLLQPIATGSGRMRPVD